MDSEIIYIVERAENHLFQVVKPTGQVIDEVDILSAEGMANRLKKHGIKVEWIDKYPTKERKHVRDLIAKFEACDVSCSYSSVRAGV